MNTSKRKQAACLLLVTLLTAPLRAGQADQYWRSRLAQIPVGATVKVRTQEGRRLVGVLMSVDESEIRVKPATRTPEPSERIQYGSLESIEQYEDHVSFGKYAAIGAAIGGAAFLMLLAGFR